MDFALNIFIVMIRKGGISFSALPLEMSTLNGSGGGGGTAFLHWSGSLVPPWKPHFMSVIIMGETSPFYLNLDFNVAYDEKIRTASKF